MTKTFAAIPTTEVINRIKLFATAKEMSLYSSQMVLFPEYHAGVGTPLISRFEQSACLVPHSLCASLLVHKWFSTEWMILMSEPVAWPNYAKVSALFIITPQQHVTWESSLLTFIKNCAVYSQLRQLGKKRMVVNWKVVTSLLSQAWCTTLKSQPRAQRWNAIKMMLWHCDT